jgi:prepilin-type N-terminal cleavage/methylation domain-containing protein
LKPGNGGGINPFYQPPTKFECVFYLLLSSSRIRSFSCREGTRGGGVGAGSPPGERRLEDMSLARDQKGFTLVEIMMVVIIIGILAVLAIPRYEKYTIESKLSEVAVAVGEIKTGMEKYYNSHGNVYPAYTSPSRLDNVELEKLLRIDLGGQENFIFEIQTLSVPAIGKTGYWVCAYLSRTGIDRAYASSDEYDRVKFYFPKELNNDPTDNWKAPEWRKGWNDDDFFTPGKATTPGL